MHTDPSKTLYLKFSNSLEDIGQLGEKIEEWGKQQSIPVKITSGMTLMLDELVTNVVMHGYGEGAEGCIEVSLTIQDGIVTAILRDWATAFDPLSRAQADTALAIDDREIGGLGIHFVRNIADEFSYRRDGDANEICLKKKV